MAARSGCGCEDEALCACVVCIRVGKWEECAVNPASFVEDVGQSVDLASGWMHKLEHALWVGEAEVSMEFHNIRCLEWRDGQLLQSGDAWCVVSRRGGIRCCVDGERRIHTELVVERVWHCSDSVVDRQFHIRLFLFCCPVRLLLFSFGIRPWCASRDE